MDDTTILGGALNQLGQTAKQTAKQAIKIPEEIAQDLAGQVGIAKPAASAEDFGPLRQSSSEASEPKQKQWQSDEERIKFLKDLYGKSDMSQDGSLKTNKQATVEGKKPSEFQEQIADKTLEEQKRLIELRNQLHKDVYYDPTFNPKNPPAGGAERPAEKVEQEKNKEMQDLQQKEAKKPPPLAIVREQNKTEMFRGAAG